MRVLVIEDDLLLGDALQAGLRGNGFAVEWLRDGESGAAALAADPFDAVVLDLGLPRLDGRRLLEQCRARGDRDHGEHAEHGSGATQSGQQDDEDDD